MPGFLAQRAQEKQRAGGQQEKPSSLRRSRAGCGFRNRGREIRTPPRAGRPVRKCKRPRQCEPDEWPRRAWPGTRCRRRFRSSTPNNRNNSPREQEQRERGGEVTDDAGEVITGRPKSERGVIERVGQPLDRPVKIGSGRVGKEEMLKPFRDQPPASDERIAQDQGGVVPDEAVPQATARKQRKPARPGKERARFFSPDGIGLDRSNKMRV